LPKDGGAPCNESRDCFDNSGLTWQLQPANAAIPEYQPAQIFDLPFPNVTRYHDPRILNDYTAHTGLPYEYPSQNTILTFEAGLGNGYSGSTQFGGGDTSGFVLEESFNDRLVGHVGSHVAEDVPWVSGVPQNISNNTLVDYHDAPVCEEIDLLDFNALPFSPSYNSGSIQAVDEGNSSMIAATSLQPIGSMTVPSTPNVSGVRIPCAQGCNKTFKRNYERVRHERSAHGINQALHLCPIMGCPKSHGVGYSRADKVKEHLWKQHANLGYTKRT